MIHVYILLCLSLSELQVFFLLFFPLFLLYLPWSTPPPSYTKIFNMPQIMNAFLQNVNDIYQWYFSGLGCTATYSKDKVQTWSSTWRRCATSLRGQLFSNGQSAMTSMKMSIAQIFSLAQ